MRNVRTVIQGLGVCGGILALGSPVVTASTVPCLKIIEAICCASVGAPDPGCSGPQTCNDAKVGGSGGPYTVFAVEPAGRGGGKIGPAESTPAGFGCSYTDYSCNGAGGGCVNNGTYTFDCVDTLPISGDDCGVSSPF